MTSSTCTIWGSHRQHISAASIFFYKVVWCHCCGMVVQLMDVCCFVDLIGLSSSSFIRLPELSEVFTVPCSRFFFFFWTVEACFKHTAYIWRCTYLRQEGQLPILCSRSWLTIILFVLGWSVALSCHFVILPSLYWVKGIFIYSLFCQNGKRIITLGCTCRRIQKSQKCMWH